MKVLITFLFPFAVMASMPGGYEVGDKRDDRLWKALDFAFGQLGFGSTYKVVETHQQIVDGINYHVAMRDKNGVNCEMYIHRSLEGSHSLTKSTCPKNRLFRRSHQWKLIGGFSETDVNDEHVQKVVKFATDKLRGGDTPSLTVTRVVKAETQIVAGVNYQITFEATNEGKTMLCSVRVWRTLKDEYELTSGSCQ